MTKARRGADPTRSNALNLVPGHFHAPCSLSCPLLTLKPTAGIIPSAFETTELMQIGWSKLSPQEQEQRLCKLLLWRRGPSSVPVKRSDSVGGKSQLLSYFQFHASSGVGQWCS